MGYHPEDQINNDYWVIDPQGFSMLILYEHRGSFVTISCRVALSLEGPSFERFWPCRFLALEAWAWPPGGCTVAKTVRRVPPSPACWPGWTQLIMFIGYVRVYKEPSAEGLGFVGGDFAVAPELSSFFRQSSVEHINRMCQRALHVKDGLPSRRPN